MQESSGTVGSPSVVLTAPPAYSMTTAHLAPAARANTSVAASETPAAAAPGKSSYVQLDFSGAPGIVMPTAAAAVPFAKGPGEATPTAAAAGAAKSSYTSIDWNKTEALAQTRRHASADKVSRYSLPCIFCDFAKSAGITEFPVLRRLRMSFCRFEGIRPARCKQPAIHRGSSAQVR